MLWELSYNGEAKQPRRDEEVDSRCHRSGPIDLHGGDQFGDEGYWSGQATLLDLRGASKSPSFVRPVCRSSSSSLWPPSTFTP